MDALLVDLTAAWRTLRRHPRFGLGAVLMLALGIGATTAVFSVVSGVLLRPLPVPHPERLSFITREGDVSIPDAVDWRRESRTYADIAFFLRSWAFDLTGSGEPARLNGMVVEPRYFGMLGIPARLGRALDENDNRRGGPYVAVVSEGFWERRLGGDPAAVGRSLILSDHPTTIVGVMPAAADLLGDSVDLWVPVAVETPWALDERGTNNFDAMGRLAEGASHEQARAEMLAITRRLADAYPKTNRGKIVAPLPLLDFMVGRVRPALLVLLGAVGLVLLTTCANLAGLLLARQAARQADLAVRVAVGAGRARLMRQVLAEGVLIAIAGGTLGTLLAWLGRDALVAAAPASLPRAEAIGVDGRVLAFALATTLLAAMLASLAPALQILRRDPAESLRSGRGGGLDPSRARLLSGLVAAEMALASVVLVGSGLLLRTFSNLQHVELGFRPQRVLRANLVLPEARYHERGPQSVAFAGIVEALSAMPGAEAAAIVIGAPLEPRSGIGDALLIEGRPPVEKGREPGARARPVLGDYFRTLDIRIVAGRAFTPEDGAQALKVAIVNQRFVREMFGGQSPLGQRVAWRDWGENGPVWMAIVGVAADVKDTTPDAVDTRAVYYPYLQRTVDWQRFGTLVVRSRQAPPGLTRQVQQAVWSVDPTLPLDQVESMEQRWAAAVAPQRFNALALGVFAIAALLVALQGLYSVLAYSVEQRRREIGVRVALGAAGADILRLVLRRGVVLAGGGLVAGLVASLALGRLLASVLFEVSPSDPSTFGAVGLALVITALLASYLPARRAARMDPAVALRTD